LNSFLFGHESKSFVDGPHRNHLEVKALAAADYGIEQLLGIGCRENKDDVLGWFFECLEESVEARLADHVDLVDHIDFRAAPLRCIANLFYEVTNVVNAVVGCGINLDEIREGPSEHLGARRTFVAWVFSWSLLAIESSR